MVSPFGRERPSLSHLIWDIRANEPVNTVLQMRFYPLHIFVKDISFITFYSQVPDSTWLGLFDPGFWAYAMMVLLAIVVNLVAQTVMYFGFRRYLQFKSGATQFLFGTILHLPTLILWWDLHNDSDPFPFQVAVVSSTLISGISYVLLNNEILAGNLKK